MTPTTVNSRIQYAADNANPHHPEMRRLIVAWNKLDYRDREKIERTMRPIIALPHVGGLVALELAAKLGIFLIHNGVDDIR